MVRKNNLNKKRMLFVYLNEEEYQLFLDGYKASSHNFKSDYCRFLILNYKGIEKNEVLKLIDLYGQIVFHLSKIGNNINQVARKANTSGIEKDDIKFLIDEKNKLYDLYKEFKVKI